jgi:hypothetical protein
MAAELDPTRAYSWECGAVASAVVVVVAAEEWEGDVMVGGSERGAMGGPVGNPGVGG